MRQRHPGQTEFLHEPDGVEGNVQFPPFVTVFGHTWMGMVIIVPTFAVGQQGHPPVIAAVVAQVS